MKNNLYPVTAAATLAVLFCLASQVPTSGSLAQYQNTAYANNFSSLSDAGWTHLSGFALSSGQTWNASSGAYQMTAPANGYNPGTGQYGFVGSIPTGLTIANGYVQSDVVTWQGVGSFGAWGVGSRLGNLAAPLAMTGYGFVYEPYGNAGAGDIRLEWLGGTGVFNSLGASNVTLIPGNKYTLTLETTGSSIVGSLWNIGQVGTSLVGQVSATDTHYASGNAGLFAITQAPIPAVDVTFDNVLVMIPEPGSGLILGLGLAAFVAAGRSWPKHS
jgi:hypothetical protein